MEQNAALFQKNRKPHSLIKVIVGRSNIYNFKIYLKERKKNIKFPLEQKKTQKKTRKTKKAWPSKHHAQLPVWKGWLVILDTDTQLNFKKI